MEGPFARYVAANYNAGAVEGGLGVVGVDGFEDEVHDDLVGFLNVVGVLGIDNEGEVAEGLELAAAFAEEADDFAAGFFHRFGGAEAVERVAGGGEEDEDVAFFGEGLDLAEEDVGEVPVVGDAGHGGGV